MIGRTKHSADPATEHVPRSTRIAQATIALHLVLLAVFVFAFRYIPLQDYPEWLYHGVLFKRIVTGDDVAGVYELAPYAPPNAVSTIAIGALNLVLEPELAGKLFLLASMWLLYAGIVRFMRITLRGCDTMLAWIALLFVFNYSFWLGNLSYYAGLGIALYGAHLLLAPRWGNSVPRTMLLVTLAYLSHFFAWFFVIWVVLASALLRRDRLRLRVLAVAAIPSIVLLVHYLATKPSVAPDVSVHETVAGFLVTRSRMLAAAVIPMQRFNGVAERGALFGAVNYLFAAGIGLTVLLAAFRFVRERRSELNVVLALPMPLLMLFLPLSSSGIVLPAQRLVVFFLLNVLAYIALDQGRLRAWNTGFFILFASVGLCSAFFFTARFDAMARAGRGPNPSSYVAFDQERAGTDGFLRLEFYDALHKPRPLPLFETGLVLYRNPAEARREGVR